VSRLSALKRNRPISQECSKILWTGKCRLRMKLRQYSICLMEWSRFRSKIVRSFSENSGPAARSSS
jgi:hypothetical protein